MAYFLSVFEEDKGSEAIVKNEIIMYSILFLKTNIQCWRFYLGLVVDLWTNMNLLLVDFFCNGSLKNQMAQLFNSIKTTN